MLIKDQFKRIDWVDLFEFKLPDISELDIRKSIANKSIVSSGDSPTYIPNR